MAAKTPITSGGPDTFMRHRRVRGGTVAVAETLAANGTTFSDRDKYSLIIEHFTDIDDTDTWTTPWGSRLKAVAVEADDPDGDYITATITADGVVTFSFTGAGTNGTIFLWCLVDPTTAGSDVPQEHR
jgi:hypothetical protein